MRPQVAGAAGSLALGLVLILLAELAHLEWTRIFGAILVALGGLWVGAQVGLSEPRRRSWLGRLRAWSGPIGTIAAVILTLPVLLTFVGLLVGLVPAARQGLDLGLVLVGGVLGLVMLVGGAASLLITVLAIRRATHSTPPERAAEQSTVEAA